MKEYDIFVDMASNLKTDIAKENLLNVIRALKYGENEWEKVGDYYVIEDYKGVRYAIDFPVKEIFCYVKPYLTVIFTSKGGIDLMADRAIRWDYLDRTESIINSRDALEVENTKKIVNKIIDIATEQKGA
jgi:hypothetical protein|nr:MAG TPA: hypothetical protein [Caudoviricetes sp.]